MSSPQWVNQLHDYTKTSMKICVWQMATAFVPYLLLTLAMVLIVSQQGPYWIVILLSPAAALFLVKIFIILHDCSHRSYLNKSPLACSVLGHICGIFTFTAFVDFKQNHLIHHATVGNLEKRGTGDIWTMTVDEYCAAPAWKKAVYRAFRNPVFLFGIAAAVKFVLINRFPKLTSNKKEVLSILFTDLMIALTIWVFSLTVGVKTYFAALLPAMFLAAGVGVWIFYIHHNFEDVYWAHEKDWDRFAAATRGAVFYELPRILRWFTGSIGYHYIHHLNAGIPNYNLVDCRNRVAELKEKQPLTFWPGLKCMWLALWDEKTGKLVGFKALGGLRRRGAIS